MSKRNAPVSRDEKKETATVDEEAAQREEDNYLKL